MLCVPPGEAPVPVVSYTPARGEHFAVAVQAFIGSTPGGPVDSFDFVVCTPRWFADAYAEADLRRVGETHPPLRGDSAARQLLGRAIWQPSDERDPVVFGTGLVFMRHWDAAKLTATVEDACARIEGPDWGAIASRLGRLLPWEFNYKYDQAVDLGEPFPPQRPAG